MLHIRQRGNNELIYFYYTTKKVKGFKMQNVNIKNAFYAALIIALVAGYIQLCHTIGGFMYFDTPNIRGL